MAWLFLILLIINIPLFFLYIRGASGSAPQGTQSAQFTDYFAKVSVGNLGVSDYTCANFNFAKNEKILRLNCPFGTMRELSEYGL